MLFNDDSRICQSLLPMPYLVALTTGKGISDPFLRLHDTFLSLKISVIKSGFKFDFVLEISVIRSCRSLSWVVTELFFASNCSKVHTLSSYASLKTDFHSPISGARATFCDCSLI